MKRSYLLRRPDEDEDYYAESGRGYNVIQAKPIDERYAKTLGDAYKGKDFVRGSEKSQQQFYGKQTVVDSPGGSNADMPSNIQPLTHDERNAISAKIIKAELKGNTELVKKLKRKLESGVKEVDSNSADKTSGETSQEEKSVLLMKMNKRTGLVEPARSKASTSQNAAEEKKTGTVDYHYNRQLDLRDMVATEKSTSATDQLTMFSRAAKMCSENNVDDDWVVDDNIMSHPKKKRHEEKDSRTAGSSRIAEHKQLERTLDSCKLCIDSKQLEKYGVVAAGLKTYLAVVPWEGLSEDHCYVAPMSHYASSLLLDEDVYEEMKLWFKGLVAMWKDGGDDEEEEDCIFIENGKHADEQRHMTIECIPVPKEIGDSAPIYFHKAIMDSEKEWSDNKKLIDLSKSQYNGNIRKAIPKGFPFFAVNFGLQPGYVHIIENQSHFPSTFGQEVISGMLDLPHQRWRNVKPMSLNDIKAKRDKLRAKWEKYDWTKIVKESLMKTKSD